MEQKEVLGVPQANNPTVTPSVPTGRPTVAQVDMGALFTDLDGLGLSEKYKLKANLPFYEDTGENILASVVVDGLNVKVTRTPHNGDVITNLIIKSAAHGVLSFPVHKTSVEAITAQVGETFRLAKFKAVRELVAGSFWFNDGNCYAPDEQAAAILKGKKPLEDIKRRDATPINIGDIKIYAIKIA